MIRAVRTCKIATIIVVYAVRMQDYQYSVLSKLYLFGKKLQAAVKKHNSDLMGQMIILRMAESSSPSISDIADILCIKVSAMTSKVAEMEHAGLLSRSVSKDKRSHTIGITPKGKTLLAEAKKSMGTTSHGDWFGLTKEEARTLESLIGKIHLEQHI